MTIITHHHITSTPSHHQHFITPSSDWWSCSCAKCFLMTINQQSKPPPTNDQSPSQPVFLISISWCMEVLKFNVTHTCPIMTKPYLFNQHPLLLKLCFDYFCLANTFHIIRSLLWCQYPVLCFNKALACGHCCANDIPGWWNGEWMMEWWGDGDDVMLWWWWCSGQSWIMWWWCDDVMVIWWWWWWRWCYCVDKWWNVSGLMGNTPFSCFQSWESIEQLFFDLICAHRTAQILLVG